LTLLSLSTYVVFALAPEARYHKLLGYSLQVSNGRLTIGEVTAGPAAGILQPADRILAWNGDDAIEQVRPAALIYRLGPHEPYTLTVLRDNAIFTATLSPMQVRNPQEPQRTIQLALIATAWAAFGLIVIALSRRERASRWCAAFMLLAAASQFGISLADIDHPVGPVQTALRFAGFAAYPWHMVCGFLMIGSLAARPSRAMTIVTAAVVSAATLYTAASASWLLALLDPLTVATIADVTLGWRGLIGRFALFSAVGGMILFLILANRHAETPTRRRRAGWLLAGMGPPAAMYFLSAAVSVAARREPALEVWYERTLMAALFTSLSVPVTFAYALVRDELFGVRLVIRRSIQYALAKSALLWLLAVPIIGFVWTIWRNPDVTVRGLVSAGTPNLYLLLAIGLSLATRERLLAAIDRRFFRDDRDRERILVRLASDIGRTEDPHEATRLAEHALAASLHPTSVQVWLRDSGRPPPEGFFTTDTVSFDDGEAPPAAKHLRVPSAQAAALSVPIVEHSGELIGGLLLGAKRSEEPYSAPDRDFLRAIARQIAMVAENASLRKAVGQERRIRHDVLEHLDRSSVDVMRECPVCGRCFDRDVAKCPDDRAELILTLPVERTIAGKYRLERLIGRGGMGAVYRATDLGIGRLVAVKVLHPHVLRDESSKRRFHREARMLGSIVHAGIVTVYDYGTLASGAAFLVMEYVDGTTWRAVLRQRGSIAPHQLADWVSQLCDALTVAHDRGIVHRDLKPENVILQQVDGEVVVKVLDFGLAKQIDDVGSDGVSRTGEVLGTMGYMSPEQLAGRAVDRRADVFAVGVMVWEALCGVRPFHGSTIADLAIAMLETSPTLPAQVPKAVRDVLRRAIAYDPSHRPATALTLRQELVPALRAR
jgi:hypothetical protein